MARLAIPRRSVSLILIKTKLNGKDAFVREPYTVVALDWGDGTPVRTYIEPAGALLRQPTPDDRNSGADLSEAAEVYDEIRTYDAPPYAKTRMGIRVI